MADRFAAPNPKGPGVCAHLPLALCCPSLRLNTRGFSPTFFQASSVAAMGPSLRLSFGPLISSIVMAVSVSPVVASVMSRREIRDASAMAL